MLLGASLVLSPRWLDGVPVSGRVRRGLILKIGVVHPGPRPSWNSARIRFSPVSRGWSGLSSRAPNLPDTRAFVLTGELEGLADQNRALASFLQDHGVDVLFQSAWDGHHWHNWRDQLRDGLMWVLAVQKHYNDVAPEQTPQGENYGRPNRQHWPVAGRRYLLADLL